MYNLVLICFIFPLVHSASLPSTELRIKYGGEALKSLERLLNFFESDIDNLNVDAVFGLRVTQGQLESLRENLNSTSNGTVHITDNNNHIQSLLKQIERTANETIKRLKNRTPEYLQQFHLLVSKPYRIDYERRETNRKYLDTGSRISDFDERQSDACFTQLLGSGNRSNSSQCLIDKKCWSLVTSSMASGYRLTHQLLWFLTAKNIGCLDNRTLSDLANKNLKHLEDRYCTNIYYDAEKNFRITENQDLFLEEILLCSMIGYEDFLRIDWFERILTWQDSNYGCFSYESETVKKRSMTKRRLLVEQQMKNGCLAHKSGVASGVLAVFARAFLQP